MKKHLSTRFRHWFYVEYRLAVFYEGSPTPRNTYARHKALLLRMADSMSVPYWVLYRRGPVGLRERPVKHGGFMM